MISNSDKQKLYAKVSGEYARAENHTRSWKEEVKDYGREYLLPKAGQDKVIVKKVNNNLTIRLATFVSDEIQITNVPMNGVLGRDTAQNADNVFSALFDSMRVKHKYREALIDDALTGVGVLAIDGWNDYKQEPILSYIDSRLTFPDPKNWQGSCMSFFGTKLRKSWYELMEDEAYDTEAVMRSRAFVDSDMKDVQRANNNIKGFNEDLGADENYTDVYNHLTIFKAEGDDKPCVYLTTWGCGMAELLRCVKMRPLTDGERADPTTINLGVILFRSKPIKGSYAGCSLIDDVGQFQDIETLLMNLQIMQATYAGLGGRTYVNTALGMDLNDAANQSGPGDIVPFTSTNPQINAQNGIYQEQVPGVNPSIQNTINILNNLSQLADPAGNALSQGMSQSGSQTKAEIQTLQQNINHTLSYMSSNLMDSIKEMWESVYRSFAANMSSQRKKEIVVVDEAGNPSSYGYKKNEFISNGDFYIKVKSKAQEDIKQKQNFAIMLSLDGSISQILSPESNELKIWKRKLLDESGIKGMQGKDFFPLTPDERKAYQDLELLNDNIKIKRKPKSGEDHNLYINIYRNYGLQTDARDELIQAREAMLKVEGPKIPQGEATGQGAVASQIGASLISAQNAGQTDVSLNNVSA